MSAARRSSVAVVVAVLVGLAWLGASCAERGGEDAPGETNDAGASEAGDGTVDAAPTSDAAASDADVDAAPVSDAASDAAPDAGACGGKGACGASGSSSVISTACGFDVDTQPELCDAFCRLENPGSASAHCLVAGEFGQFLCSCP